MRDKIIALANEALKSKDHESTWYHTLDVKDGKRWAICFAWMDWDNENTWRLYGKIAYQTTNTLMQEYDMDWDMPTTNDGEVDDTELSLAYEDSEGISEVDIDWLIEQWERIKEEYVYPFDKLDEILEEFDVKYDHYKRDDGSWYGLVEFWTDTAGQDICEEFDFNGTQQDFAKQFIQCAENYDVDDEVELYVDSRGKNGVPSTVRELLDDCQEAKDTLIKIANKLKEKYKIKE